VDVGDLTVPLVPAETQSELVAAIDRCSAERVRLVSLLTRQIGLLVEHRQALITAVVRGEFEVRGVMA
jgi:hypothetical protein